MLPLEKMPRVPGFDVPRELYCVALDPAPLFGMPYPASLTSEDWTALAAAGARVVLCLTSEAPGYDPSPLVLLAPVALEDLVHGEPPRNPVVERQLVQVAVERALSELREGSGVVVHCAGGTGRTGTVLGSILVRSGHEPERVVAYFDAVHRARGCGGWPEAAWQAEVVRAAGHDRPID